MFTVYSFFPCAVRSLTRSAYVALYKCYIFGSCPTMEEKIRPKNHAKSEPRTKDRAMLRNGNIQRTVKEKDDIKMTIQSHSKIAERADIIVPHVSNGSKEDSGRSKIKAKSESVTFLKRKDDNKEKKIAARADRTVIQKGKDEDSENSVTSQAKMAAQAARAGHLKVNAKSKKRNVISHSKTQADAGILLTQQRHFGLADLLKNQNIP